jgi:hypothetical protein
MQFTVFKTLPHPSIILAMGDRAKLGNLSRMSNIAQTADQSTGYSGQHLERRSRLMTPQRPNWHELAEQASKELDPVRLMSLVVELNRALEQNEQTSMRLQTQKFV